MTIIEDLTPHTWSAAESTHARVALQCAIQGNFGRMEEHLRGLPLAALIDLRYALDVMHPMVRLLPMTREMSEQSLTPQDSVAGRDQGSLMVVEVVPSYGLAHNRIRIDRGPARDLACVDCGRSPSTWSLAHERVGERLMRDPRPFSMDPADYDPRCMKCHHRYDIAHGKVVGKRWVAKWSRSRRSRSSESTSVDGNDRVPCGRCGHDERNEESVTDFVARTGVATSVTYCPDCPGGVCSPVVLVPAGVEGWAIEGRAK